MISKKHTLLTLKALAVCKPTYREAHQSLRAISKLCNIEGATGELKVRGALENHVKARRMERVTDRITDKFAYRITQQGLDYIETNNLEAYIAEQEEEAVESV
jgi:hypothetical protein